MKIIKIKDNRLETHNLFIKIIRIFTVPLLNNIPTFLMKKILSSTSRDGADVVKSGGSTHALEAMYSRYERNLFSRGFFQGIADLFWHHCLSQPKAIRNRLKIVENSFRAELNSLASSGMKRDIVILTIAGGSARAVISSIRKFKEQGLDYNIKVINIDKSLKAIELSKEIAKKSDIYNDFKWINEDARNINRLITEGSIDIVEMVGLLDYFSDERGIQVMSQIYKSLKSNGLFIVGNIRPNSEMKFIHKIGWPEMYYRDTDNMENILKESGFFMDKGKLIMEPLNTHIIATIRK